MTTVAEKNMKKKTILEKLIVVINIINTFTEWAV
jgi:hypothetical protein